MQQLALSPPRQPLARGLWSLWDMLKFHADRFVSVLNIVADMEVLWRDPKWLSDTARRAAYASQIGVLCDQLKELQLPVSAKQAELVRSLFADNPVTDNSMWAVIIQHRCNELRQRIEHELEGKALYFLAANVEFLEAKVPLFGAAVHAQFPSAAYDIEEAGKCLALSRATACVMHLMRATEVALKALSQTLGVGQQNDWGAYIREIGKELSARAAGAGKRTPDEAFFSEAASSFDHVRRSWRNPTMHIEKVYTEERAADIFEATRSFMRHLATKISE